MFRYVPSFRILNVNIRGDVITLENRGCRNRAAWVLTGGRSSRMGTDKALIEIGGRAMALRVAEEAGNFCIAGRRPNHIRNPGTESHS
jgi:hypothetical protein